MRPPECCLPPRPIAPRARLAPTCICSVGVIFLANPKKRGPCSVKWENADPFRSGSRQMGLTTREAERGPQTNSSGGYKRHAPAPACSVRPAGTSGSRPLAPASGGQAGNPRSRFSADHSEAGAVLGPPFDTPTSAGRKTRSPIFHPLWTTCVTVPAGSVSSGASNIA